MRVVTISRSWSSPQLIAVEPVDLLLAPIGLLSSSPVVAQNVRLNSMINTHQSLHERFRLSTLN
jgi:hypothetical protein